MTCPDEELQLHHHLCGVSDEIDGLASECSKGRQDLEMEKRLRPLAENCFSPLLLPKMKTRK